MAFLAELQSGKKLKATKTKIKNVDGSTSIKSPYEVSNPQVNQCPDVHLPKSRFVAPPKTQTDEEKTQSGKKDDNSEVLSIQVTHISDTHLKHNNLRSLIPFADILIHSGDFCKSCRWPNAQQVQQYITANNAMEASELKKYIPQQIYEFNEWLATLPHKYKVVIGGNHEIALNGLSAEFIQKYLLSNCIYLQDSSVTLCGLKIYGSPWTTCSKMGFSFDGNWQFLYSKWQAIPSDTDIVVTHLPPLGIFDLAWGSKYNNTEQCKQCGEVHIKFAHWGCQQLLGHIQQRVRPKMHLFGHVHDEVGYKMDEKSGVLFVNSAMDIERKAHRVKVVFDQ